LHYVPPRILFNGHVETIYPALIRKVDLTHYKRERISTPDDDFLDLDWLAQESDKLVILSHGLEGNSTRAYVKGMARALLQQGFDVLAWNYRGCSGEMNRQLRFYHSGATDDLDTVIRHALSTRPYTTVHLIGFSLGGNLTLKYLGENRKRDSRISKAIAFSTPMDLYTGCLQISQRENWLYSKRFLKSLRKKVLQKAAQKKELDVRGLEKIKTLMEFDDFLTGPIHGFKDARDYYEQCSSIRFVNDIQIPSLIVNAWNDPFLSPECYPINLLSGHAFVQLEIPERGGHVGFTQFNKNGLYWSEQRAIGFLNQA
jgi:uncharacterized protein